MKEIFGNRFDVRVIIDGKEYYPKEVNLMSSDGASFKWKQRHWNTGTKGMAGAFDVVHRLPEGLKKSDCGPWCHECNKCKGCDCGCTWCDVCGQWFSKDSVHARITKAMHKK